MNKFKIKKNDTVKILAGKEKGKTGRVLKIDRENERVYVQGLNMVKKAMRKRNQQDKGGIVEIEAPIHISNVALVTKDGTPTRIGYQVGEDGSKTRIARKTGEAI